LDSHTERRTKDKGVREQGVERIPESKVENNQIFLEIKLRRMRGTAYLARVGDTTGAYKILVGICDVREMLEDVEVDGRIILESIL
jgi:hypothetical protein